MALTIEQKQKILQEYQKQKGATSSSNPDSVLYQLQQQETQKAQDEEGIIAKIAEPFMKGTASVANLAETLYHVARKDWASANKSIRKDRDFGVLGKARPIGMNQETGEDLSAGGFVKDVVGTGAEIGSYAAPVGIGGKIVKGAAPTVAQLALGGAISSGLAQGGSAAQDQSSVGEIIEETVKGGAAGAIAGPIIGKVLGGLTSLVTKPSKNINDVASQIAKNADSVPQIAAGDVIEKGAKVTREVAEESAPKMSFIEKWTGMRPDIKKRIAGKGDLMQEYFDISYARNLDDTVPTPLEYAARAVEKVKGKLDEVLNDTGSEIGKFREKVSTYSAPRESVESLTSNFQSNLKKLNLEVNEGVVQRMKGRVKGKASDSEVKVLQDLYDDLLTISESPTLENLIDLRNAFDRKINFAKASKEVSNTVDPLSRSLRHEIAQIGEKIVGKSQAKNLSKYSNLRALSDELSEFVDSKSGAEFLLKRVLSERGRLPRELMDALREVTGTDLLDHATMAQLATELIGNPAQQGLFRQEITRAGGDILDLLEGGTSGAIKKGAKWLLERGVNSEDVYLKAAGKSKAPSLPKGKAVASAEQKAFHSSRSGKLSINKWGLIDLSSEVAPQFGKPKEVNLTGLKIIDVGSVNEMFDLTHNKESLQDLIKRGYDIIRSPGHLQALDPKSFSRKVGIELNPNNYRKSISDIK